MQMAILQNKILEIEIGSFLSIEIINTNQPVISILWLLYIL